MNSHSPTALQLFLFRAYSFPKSGATFRKYALEEDALKICYIIVAHHQPNTFKKLISHLSTKHADIVVHIDRRVNEDLFRTPDNGGVHFMQDRRAVHWAGGTQTSTMCDALAYGLGVSNADYFILLAGTDFPLQSQDRLVKYLSDRHPANLLNWYPLVPGVWGYGLINEYRLNDLARTFMPLDSAENKYMHNLVIRVQNLLNKHLLPKDTTWTRFFHGSTRWCLNRETVEFVTRYFQSEEGRYLHEYLELSENSDEIFFQTAILNSPLRNMCAGYDEQRASDIFAGKSEPMPDEMRVYLHYVDWNPEREDPAVLVESDLPALKASGKFFAYKFLDGRSDKLLQLIEEEMLNQ